MINKKTRYLIKLSLLIISLFFTIANHYSLMAQINLGNPNYGLLDSLQMKDVKKDSIIFITNEMIRENIKLNSRIEGRVILKTAVACSYPAGWIATAWFIHNWSEENTRRYAPSVLYLGSVALPMSISVLDQYIASKSARLRIASQYKDYKIVDKSNFLVDFWQRYHLVFGLNYTKVMTTNCEAEPGIIFGYGRHWRLSRRIALNLDYLYEEYRCYIKYKIIRSHIDWWTSDNSVTISRTLSDIRFYYKILKIPLTLDCTLISFKDLSFRLHGGYGVGLIGLSNSKEMVKQNLVTITVFDYDSIQCIPYDFEKNDEIFPISALYPEFYYSIGIGLSYNRIEADLRFNSDTSNKWTKFINRIVIEQPVKNVSFTIRYYL